MENLTRLQKLTRTVEDGKLAQEQLNEYTSLKKQFASIEDNLKELDTFGNAETFSYKTVGQEYSYIDLDENYSYKFKETIVNKLKEIQNEIEEKINEFES